MQSFISGWVLIFMMSLGAIGGSTLESEALAFRLEVEHMYTVNGGMDLSGDEALFYIEMPQFDEEENITTAKIYVTKDYMFVDKASAIESALRMVNIRGDKSYVASENPYKEELTAIETTVRSEDRRVGKECTFWVRSRSQP